VLTTTYRIEGMTCAHCERAVVQELMGVEGIRSVSVDLVPQGVSAVTVASDRAPSSEQVAAAVAEAGYTLVVVP
jgi:copper chaperone CopZ